MASEDVLDILLIAGNLILMEEQMDGFMNRFIN